MIVDKRPDPAFYRKAVTDFCQIDEAVEILESMGAQYRGYKNRRGLIGATAAVASVLEDRTSEILVYRQPERWGLLREVDRSSLFAAEESTFPHTWDTVDRVNDVVVCVPHTPDPVLFRIRGESPSWVMMARSMVESEKAGLEQIWVTNQGTGVVTSLLGESGNCRTDSGTGSMELFQMNPKPVLAGMFPSSSVMVNSTVRCMAYEPTKKFRLVVRQLVPDDDVIAVGSYKKGSINLEKLKVNILAKATTIRPPICTACIKRMTSDGKDKGFKRRKCGAHANDPEIREISRTLKTGMV